MEKKILKALVFLISFLYSEEMSFKELTKLASHDLGTNIYLDRDIKDYSVDFNIVDHQNKGEIYEFYKIVLFNHNMFLQYNSQGKFFFIKKKNIKVEPLVLNPLPIAADKDKRHYYSYKIKHITNKDVVNTMKIFPEVVKYVYLEQSDMIAYSSTKEEHISIKRMLQSSDNEVKHAVVKITLFATKKDKMLSYGSNIRALSFSVDNAYDSIFDNILGLNQAPAEFTMTKSANFNFTLFALAGRGVVEIFQEPILRLTNGVSTSVNSVNNVPFKEGSTTIKDATQTTTDQISYRDIGLRINVKPKIKDNWVYLELDLISEEILSLDNNLPITQKITYKSSIKAERGKSILLTGIRKTSMKYERDGIPLLSDIPFIGELFKKQTKSNDESNINILIEVL